MSYNLPCVLMRGGTSRGPFFLADWLPQAHVTLERNPHFREPAPIPAVRFHVTEDAASELRRFEAGGLHITETLPPQPLAHLRERFGDQLRISPYLGSFWLGYNLDQPPFKNRETVTRYRFGEDKPAAETPDDGHTPAWLKLLQKWLNSQHLGTLASVIEVLLWSLVIGAIVWLAWRYRDWLHAFVSRRAKLPDLKASRASPQQAFGLDLDRETLPADIAASAENLWQSNPREALGLLYRALLSHLLHEYHLALTPADTEGQVLTRIERLQRPELLAFSQNLTHHWQNMAYGHRVPAPSVQQALCEGWRRLFGAGAQP